MKTNIWRLLMLMTVALLVTSCSEDDEPEIPWYEDIATLQSDYAKALIDAQYPDASKVSTTLMPISENNPELEWITVDGKKMVLVCAITNQPSLRFWAATDTFRLSKQTGLWVTLPQEWKHRAGQYAGMDSGQEQIAGKTANKLVNRAGRLSRCTHGSCFGGPFI